MRAVELVLLGLLVDGFIADAYILQAVTMHRACRVNVLHRYHFKVHICLNPKPLNPKPYINPRPKNCKPQCQVPDETWDLWNRAFDLLDSEGRLGFRVQGFRGLGFTGLGFRGLGV